MGKHQAEDAWQPSLSHSEENNLFFLQRKKKRKEENKTIWYKVILWHFMASMNIAFPKGDFREEVILQLNILYIFLAHLPSKGHGQ